MKDTFGYALLSYWQGDHKTPHIIKRDDGRINKESLKHYFEKYAQFSSIEKRALKYAKGKILDVGCGTGRLSVRLDKMGAQITALDISPKILNILKIKNPKIKTVIADAEKLPFADNSFDIVVSAFLIVHLQNPKIFFAEAYRVLKPEGKFILTNINQKKSPELKTKKGLISIKSYYHRPEKIIEMLEDLAFAIKENIFVKERDILINQLVSTEK